MLFELDSGAMSSLKSFAVWYDDPPLLKDSALGLILSFDSSAVLNDASYRVDSACGAISATEAFEALRCQSHRFVKTCEEGLTVIHHDCGVFDVLRSVICVCTKEYSGSAIVR